MTFVLLLEYNVDEAGLPVDEIGVSSFEESSNGNDVSSLGSDFDDLDRSEPSAEPLCHSDLPFDRQGDSERTNLSEEQVESSDDLSDLDSDYDVSKTTQVLWRVNNFVLLS